MTFSIRRLIQIAPVLCYASQATAMLGASGRFETVIGMDPSEGMIEAAQSAIKTDVAALLGGQPSEKQLKDIEKCNVRYSQGSAEDLRGLDSESIDLVTAGTVQ